MTHAGDTILVDLDTATTKEVVPGSGPYAVLNYRVHIKGGTGKFAGARGDFNKKLAERRKLRKKKQRNS